MDSPYTRMFHWKLFSILWIQKKTVSLLFSQGSTLNSEWSQELVYYANSQLYLTRNFCPTTHHLWLLTPLLNLYHHLLIDFLKLDNWIECLNSYICYTEWNWSPVIPGVLSIGAPYFNVWCLLRLCVKCLLRKDWYKGRGLLLAS